MDQVAFELQCERGDLVVNPAAFDRQVENRAAFVRVGKLAIQAAVLDQFGNGPADGHLVEHRPRGNLDGREAGKATQDGDNPPFGYGKTEALFIDAGNLAADRVRENGEAIRKEFFQDQLLSNGFRIFFSHFVTVRRVRRDLRRASLIDATVTSESVSIN